MKEFSPEQIARMTPEARARYEKRLKIVKRNRKILAAVVAGLVAVVMIATLSMTVLFNISTIKVTKAGAVYSANEIINASGLSKGDNLIRTDFEKASQRIQRNLPYILEATINKKLSGEVTISVKDTTAAIIFRAADGYAIADIRGKVLEIVKEVPEDAKFLIIKVKGAMNAVPGEMFGFENEAEKKLYDSIVEHLKKAEIFEKTTAIDLTDKNSLKIEYQNRLRLLLGSADELDVKLRGGIEVIRAEDSKDQNTIAEINLMIPKKVFVNSIESLEAPTVVTLPEEDTTDTDSTDISEEDSTGTTADTVQDDETTSQEEQTEEKVSE